MTTKTYSTSSTARRAAKVFAEKTNLVNLEDLQLTGDKDSGYMVVFICRSEEATAAVREAGFAAENLYPDQLGPTDAEAAGPKASTYIRETSSTEKPTKRVWAIADSMVDPTTGKAVRKDVIAACRKAGIAYGTARTQYQAWLSAKNS